MEGSTAVERSEPGLGRCRLPEKPMPFHAAFLGPPREVSLLLGVVALWVLLQFVILPRLGVPT
jgi:hypothetical protein